MRKTITLLAACLAICAGSNAQTTIATQDFESSVVPTLPAGWGQNSTAAIGWRTDNAAYSWPAAVSSPTIPAHTTYAYVDAWDDSIKSNASDVLMSSAINLSAYPHPYMTLDYLIYGFYRLNSTGTAITSEEFGIIEASVDGGTTWTTLDTLSASAGWSTSKPIDLSAVGGKSSVIIGIKYTDEGTHLVGMAVDNIKVYQPASVDLSLYTINPNTSAKTSLSGYNVAGADVPISGYVYNNGYSPISSFTYNFIQSDGTTATNTITLSTPLAYAQYASFTANSPAYKEPASGTNLIVKTWVSATGDVNAGNDSMNAEFNVVSKMPAKRLTIEEGTGIWCGFCPRGKVYMDSIHNAYPNDVTIISVHNQAASSGRYDPLWVSTYDNYFVANYIGSLGWPSICIDRREVDYPDYVFNYYQQDHGYFGFADINVTKPTISGSSLNVSGTVTPAINLSGDYRVALVLTEDRVHHSKYSANPAPDPDGEWNQEDYYSQFESTPATYAPDGVHAIHLAEPGLDFYELPTPVPDTLMYYDYTARYISDVTGKAGSLPSSMTSGTSYPFSFTGVTLDPSWNVNEMKAVILLIRESDTVILNNNFAYLGTEAVANVNASIDGVHIYPNPANDITNVTFNLNNSTNVQLQVVDMVGRVVYSTPSQDMNTGFQKITIPTSNLSQGLYNVRIVTDNGIITERLSVIK